MKKIAVLGSVLGAGLFLGGLLKERAIQNKINDDYIRTQYELTRSKLNEKKLQKIVDSNPYLKLDIRDMPGPGKKAKIYDVYRKPMSYFLPYALMFGGGGMLASSLARKYY